MIFRRGFALLFPYVMHRYAPKWIVPARPSRASKMVRRLRITTIAPRWRQAPHRHHDGQRTRGQAARISTGVDSAPITSSSDIESSAPITATAPSRRGHAAGVSVEAVGRPHNAPPAQGYRNTGRAAPAHTVKLGPTPWAKAGFRLARTFAQRISRSTDRDTNNDTQN